MATKDEKRIVYANALESEISKMFRHYGDGTYPGDYAAMIHNETLVDVLETINEQPAVDAVPVVHGRLGVSYIDEYYGEFANCLECGTDNILPCHYCRNCGAKMEGGTADGQ